jgi:hypothetical protein
VDAMRFDRFACTLFDTATRRAMLGLGAGGLLAALGLEGGWARKTKKKCKKKCGPCQKCKKGKCKPVAAGTSCGAGKQCFANGSCKACDVCLGDCAFTSLQDAVTAASHEATIQICPGRYPTNAQLPTYVTLVGAGSGAGGTVLDGQGRGRVLFVEEFISITVRGLTITGGVADTGAGIDTSRATISLEDIHLTDNHSSGRGGAIHSYRSEVFLSNSRVTDNSASDGGGIYNGDLSTLELKANSVVTGNDAPDNGGGPDARGAGGIRNVGGTVEISEGSSVSGNTPVNCLGTPAC